MFDIDRWQQIYSVLKKNKLRTFLTAFGVFWGIFMLMVQLGAGSGLKNGVMHGLKDFATNSMFIWGGETGKAYHGFKKGRRIRMNSEDIAALRHQVSQAAIIAPKVRMWAPRDRDNVFFAQNSGAYTIVGDDPGFAKIDPVVVTSGRYINTSDEKNHRKVAVIGQRVKKELFSGKEDIIGQYIRIQGVYFQVIGSFKPLNPNINFGGDKERMVITPISSFQQAFNYGDRIGMLGVMGKKGASIQEVEADVLGVLKSRHHVAPDDEKAFGNFNFAEEFKKISGLFTGINSLIWIVGIGTLLAGIIGVSNIMLIVVRERTKEIGVQRAIGATPRSIIKQILLEAAVLTIFSGYMGLVFGTAVVELISMAIGEGGGDMMFTNPEIDFHVALASLLVLSVFGVVAGILPARRAVQIRPIEAIRTE